MNTDLKHWWQVQKYTKLFRKKNILFSKESSDSDYSIIDYYENNQLIITGSDYGTYWCH